MLSAHNSEAKTQMLGTVPLFFLLFWSWKRQHMTPAVGSLGWVCSGISKLAEEMGPPQRSDVTNSSRECFTFLFLAVVRSFPESRGKNTVGLFSGAFGRREWREPKDWDWNHMAVWEYLWVLAPLLPRWFLFLKSQDRAPTKHTHLLFQRITFHINWHPLILFCLCKLLSGVAAFML